MTAQPTKLAYRLAALASIDLSRIGSGGEIKARDVAALLPVPEKAVAPASLPVPAEALPTTYSQRLSTSKREVPHFYQTVSVKLDALFAFADSFGAERPSLVEIVLMATARLLRRTPLLNAAWRDDAMLLYDRVDILLAKGGSVALIADADRKGLRAIAESIDSGEGGSGTFVIADFSESGMSKVSAIVDPLHAGVLAIATPQHEVALREGVLVAERICHLTLSADHRAIDGSTAAEFLFELKSMLEDPLKLML
ncbi:MAG: 2-oxo acid dehydrogenase subunit E2 [Reyranellaceae bacterium]